MSTTRVELVDCAKRGEKVEKPVVESLRARSAGVTAVLIAAAITLWSADMFGWGKPKSSLTGEWKKAEELLLPWVKQNRRDFKVEKVEADTRWPYMLELNRYPFLVHNGQVLEYRKCGGLERLSAYLRDIKFLERKEIDAALILDIVDHFDAYGPDKYSTSYLNKPTRVPPELYPRTEIDADGVKLILVYGHEFENGPPGTMAPPVNPPYYLDRWTLTIPRDYHLSWHEVYFEMPRPAEYR